MGKKLVRASEAIRRFFGRPGRRTGIERRQGFERKTSPGRFEHTGLNPKGGPGQMVSTAGPDMRRRGDRRKKGKGLAPYPVSK